MRRDLKYLLVMDLKDAFINGGKEYVFKEILYTGLSFGRALELCLMIHKELEENHPPEIARQFRDFMLDQLY